MGLSELLRSASEDPVIAVASGADPPGTQALISPPAFDPLAVAALVGRTSARGRDGPDPVVLAVTSTGREADDLAAACAA